jgi:hypothetical protein
VTSINCGNTYGISAVLAAARCATVSTLSPCSSVVDMSAASVLAAFVEHILTAVASPSPTTTMAPPMTPAPTPPLAELTLVAQFQTSSSIVATIVFFQQLTAQVCFITFSIAQPQF